ncbi:MAG: hypothetical protein HQK51_13930 [Oligoflexia bacterium]|nr:hypothetical protein [Oligoflexia bacterium]
MKRFLILFLILFLSSKNTYADNNTNAFTIRAPQGVIPERCSEDNLSPEEAIERLYWANRCGYLSTRYLDFCLNDDNGSTRARPIYPSFVSSDFSKAWAACPKNRNADCNIPQMFQVVQPIFCISSCYTPDQKILFPKGEVAKAPIEIPIIDAYLANIKSVMTVNPMSSIDNIILEETPVKFYTKEAIDTNNKIIVITTEKNKKIKVTENHPLIDGDGFIKEAKDFLIFDFLLNQYGQKEKIIDISYFNHHGKVYNLLPDSNNLLNNIIVAEGLLSGSAFYQNDGVIYLNRKILRDNKLPLYKSKSFCENIVSKKYLLWKKLSTKLLLTKNEQEEYNEFINDYKFIKYIFEQLSHSPTSPQEEIACEKSRMGLIDSIFLISKNNNTKKEIKELIEKLIRKTFEKKSNNNNISSLENSERVELMQILNGGRGFMGTISN